MGDVFGPLRSIVVAEAVLTRWVIEPTWLQLGCNSEERLRSSFYRFELDDRHCGAPK